MITLPTPMSDIRYGQDLTQRCKLRSLAHVYGVRIDVLSYRLDRSTDLKKAERRALERQKTYYKRQLDSVLSQYPEYFV